MRTQKEIIDRFDNADDMLGTQKTDLISYMEFKNAEPHLREDYVKKVKKGKEKWKPLKDAKKEILDYLDFAYEKAENERGISASRSMLHFKTWIWLDDEDFYNKVIDMVDNYTDYGIPTLNKISKHYGYKRN